VFLTLIYFFSFAVENTVYKQVRGIKGEILGTVVNNIETRKTKKTYRKKDRKGKNEGMK
jgi:hypothetical protein